jgi:glycosyltransferase involved in cell wall biosynthesis
MSTTLRIAQVAPLFESVPPEMYGGTERVVSNLTEELLALGHSVTLFASGGSRTGARLIPSEWRSLRLQELAVDPVPPHMLILEQVIARESQFDVIHFHTDLLHLPFTRRLTTPHVTTLHGRLDLPNLDAVYREYAEVPLVSISDAQRMPLPDARWLGTVQHGLSRSALSLGDGDGQYLAFLGRISPEKRPDRAIRIAAHVGMPLKIAAKVDAGDREYFEREIAPLLAHPLVEFVGEIGDAEKQEFLGEAAVLLFPIDWDEPFGMVMIESMACGTPVVAFKGGSVPEVIEEGVTGYIVRTVEEAVVATGRAMQLDRARCREAFEARFAAERMAEDYMRIYEALVSGLTQLR